MPVCPSCHKEKKPDQCFCAHCGCNLSGQTGQLSPNELLQNRYLLAGVLGRGGMGAVYKAFDQRLNNMTVAVKEMSTNALGPGKIEEATEAFKKEASILVDLRHPALPRITDFFCLDSGRWYLVMDFIKGGTLQSIAQRRGPIPEAEVLKWARQLCEVLDYLHTQSPPIIFRDLKPSNIMITPSNEVILIDFGIARHFKREIDVDTTAYGSPGFSPPEQYGSGQTSPRSDIYSLGVTLHYLLTGLEPGKDPFSFRPPGTAARVSPALDSIITKAIEIDPQKRYGSARQMLGELPPGNNCQVLQHTEYLSNPTVAMSTPPEYSYSNKSFQEKTPVLKWSAIFAVAVMFTVGVSTAVYFGLKGDKDIDTKSNNRADSSLEKKSESSTTLPKTAIWPSESNISRENQGDGRWPWTGQRPVSDMDLKGLSAWELSIMRNEIYARHGWVFELEEFRNYFISQNWYKPMDIVKDRAYTNEMVNQMSSLEKDNARFILEYQKKNGLMY